MGLTFKNQNKYELNTDISSYFTISSEPPKDDDYSELKKDIYKLDIDIEEKANILNKINSLPNLSSEKNRNKIILEINNFKNKYNL